MAIVAAVWAIGSIKTDVAVIKETVTNHLATISHSIDKIETKNEEQDKTIIEINLKMAEILSALKR